MSFTIGEFTVTSTSPGCAEVRRGDEPSWPIRYFVGEFTREVAEKIARDEPHHRNVSAALASDESEGILGYSME